MCERTCPSCSGLTPTMSATSPATANASAQKRRNRWMGRLSSVTCCDATGLRPHVSRAGNRELTFGGEHDTTAHPEVIGVGMDADAAWTPDFVALADQDVGVEVPLRAGQEGGWTRKGSGSRVLHNPGTLEEHAHVQSPLIQAPHQSERRRVVALEHVLDEVGAWSHRLKRRINCRDQ